MERSYQPTVISGGILTVTVRRKLTSPRNYTSFMIECINTNELRPLKAL